MSFIPRLNPILIFIPAPVTVATAGTSDTQSFYTAEFPGQVVGAQLIDNSGITGDATNYVTVTVQKGATVMYTFATSSTPANDVTVDVPKALTAATSVTNRRFAAADVLKVVWTKAASGVAVIGGVTVALMQSAYDHSEGQ